MKKALRTKLLAQRNALTPEYILTASTKIRELLFELPAFKHAYTIMLYISMGSEVGTEEMIRQSLLMGKRVAVPYLQQQVGKMDASEIRDMDTELTLGKYNTLMPKPEYYRPIDPRQLQLILVPAIAFDVHGNRMGYGGGYYDRYLKTVGPHAVLVGVNFSGQIVNHLPTNRYDIPVQMILHEQGIMQTARKIIKTP